VILAVIARMAAATPVSSCNVSGDDGPFTFGSSCRGVCEVYSIGIADLQLNCDTANGGSGRTVAWAVSDYDGGGADRFSVFGIDGNGNLFCCVEESADITEVLIDGGDHVDGDFLSFTYDNASGGGVDADLEADVERATIQGNDGADEMYGTTVFTSDSTVWSLEGGNHADTIQGFSADENFDGGNGGDNIECGGGHDSAEGGPGSDDIAGGNGIPHLEGDTDGDVVHGGNDADTLLGGGGTDRKSVV
jgi:Ca2+-binding RTX toxin-like protein